MGYVSPPTDVMLYLGRTRSFLENGRIVERRETREEWLARSIRWFQDDIARQRKVNNIIYGAAVVFVVTMAVAFGFKVRVGG